MVLDGELFSVGDDDNVNFNAIGRRMMTRRVNRAVTLCAFDVLWLDGIDFPLIRSDHDATTRRSGNAEFFADRCRRPRSNRGTPTN